MQSDHNTIASIHQPNYLPWLGYFYKIFQSDVFVFLDDVQFASEGMQHYHYIKTPQGRMRLKIPVNGSTRMNINEVCIRNELKWKKQHLRTIELNYKKAPFFDEIFSDYKGWLETGIDTISELSIHIIKDICSKFNIVTSFRASSGFNLNSRKTEKVIDICKCVGATVYYSGTGAKAYQLEDHFSAEGIELRYSSFTPFAYKQLWGDFDSNVSILDYLMHCGYDWDRVVENQKRK